MPRRSWTIRDAAGNPVGIACGTVPWCTECRRRASSKQCDYPVKRRNGKPGTCDRHLCSRCAINVGPDRDYCPAHHRLSQRETAK